MQSAYEEILNQYRTAVQNDFFRDILNGKSDNWDIIGENVNLELLSGARYYDDGFTVYYAYEDIAGRGIPLLLIGAGGAGEPVHNYDIFSYNGSKAIPMFDQDFGGRVNFTIYSDGIISVSGSGSATDGMDSFYKISSNGYSPVVIESILFVSNYDNDAVKYYLRSDDKFDIDNAKEISRTEYDSIHQKYSQQPLYNIDWKVLAGASKKDVSNLMGQDFWTVVNQFGGMYNVGVPDESKKAYSNGILVIGTGREKADIHFICIIDDCEYSIKGLYYGMGFKTANQYLLANGWTLQEENDDNKWYINEEYTILFNSETGQTISRIDYTDSC
jgi:hypothetical protein